MLTRRGRFLLLVVLIIFCFALANSSTLSLVCVTLLLWFLINWLYFALHVRVLQSALHVERHLENERGAVATLWAGGKFQVRVQLQLRKNVDWSYIRITDRVSPLLEVLDAAALVADGPLNNTAPITLTYGIRCAAPGSVRFEGLQVQMADLQGFFVHTWFVRAAVSYRILPAMLNYRGKMSALKRSNLLPLLGVHRHRRPGSGSELLDIRDYIPGDPPKTIAWKVSARRGRLMTKEFESEVPIRCTLFVDASSSVRVGIPGKNAMARIVEIAAGVAQASAAARDLTGLCLFDERAVRVMRPARGPDHLVSFFNMLADVAALPSDPMDVPVGRLLPVAYGLAQEVYPDLLHADVNHFPLWLPLWSPQPGWTLPRPPIVARTLWRRPGVWLRRRVRWTLLNIKQAILGRLLPGARRNYARRKQLAGLLSARYGFGAGGLAALLEDDYLCSRCLQRFLAEHQTPADLPHYDFQGRYLFAAANKIKVLTRALLTAVAHGRDNELFVLLADVLELDDKLEPLLAAVKVAIARHHHVMLVCPWPHGLPPAPAEAAEASGAELPGWLARVNDSLVLDGIVRQANMLRYHNAYRRVRRQFSRLGVPVLMATQEDSVRLILDRLEQLRAVERGVRM